MSEKVFDLGPIRPTSEGASLLLRVTKGCAWNRCRFCNNYRTHPFALRDVQELMDEIDMMADYRDRILRYQTDDGFDMEKVNADFRTCTASERQCYNLVFRWLHMKEFTLFMQDADAMILPADQLCKVLAYIRKKLPEVTRITSYGRPDTLARKSAADMKRIYEAGLNRIHAGFETGCDEVLRRVEKGVTSAQQIEGGQNVMSSGIELSVFLMAGLGGEKLSDQNADDTAKVINAVNPSFVRLRTAVVIEGTPLWQDQQNGLFDECTDMQQLREMRRFLAGLQGCTGNVYSDHMINLLQELEGPLTDTASLLAYMDEFLNLPRDMQRKYQLAKRMGFNGTFKQMQFLSEKDSQMLNQYLIQYPDGPAFEKILKDCLRQYI